MIIDELFSYQINASFHIKYSDLGGIIKIIRVSATRIQYYIYNLSIFLFYSYSHIMVIVIMIQKHLMKPMIYLWLIWTIKLMVKNL